MSEERPTKGGLGRLHPGWVSELRRRRATAACDGRGSPPGAREAAHVGFLGIRGVARGSGGTHRSHGGLRNRGTPRQRSGRERNPAGKGGKADDGHRPVGTSSAAIGRDATGATAVKRAESVVRERFDPSGGTPGRELERPSLRRRARRVPSR